MPELDRPEHRLLTNEECALLEWLVANGGPETKQFASQIPEIMVVGSCTRGCPSIDFAIGDRDQRKTGPSHLLADLEGRTPEGIQVGVILDARDGEISELEVYAIDNVKESFPLPRIESLK